MTCKTCKGKGKVRDLLARPPDDIITCPTCKGEKSNES